MANSTTSPNGENGAAKGEARSERKGAEGFMELLGDLADANEAAANDDGDEGAEAAERPARRDRKAEERKARTAREKKYEDEDELDELALQERQDKRRADVKARRAKPDADDDEDGDEPTDEDFDALFGPDDEDERSDDDDDESVDELTDDDEDADDEDDDEEGTAADRRTPRSANGQPAADSIHEVVVNGKKQQVTFAELQKGYSREQDYTVKTQELAAVRSNYEGLIDSLNAYLDAQDGEEPDWEKMKEEDPLGFAAEWHSWEQKKARKALAASEKQRIVAEKDAERRTKFDAHMQEQRALLPKLIPAWEDRGIARREYAVVRAYMAEQGFSEQEISGLVDARAIALIRKAALYDRIKRSGNGKIKPVRLKRTAVAPGAVSRKSSSSPRRSGSGREVEAARNELRRKGTDRAAESFFEKALG